MRTMRTIGLFGLLALGLAGCESRTDKTDGGGVLLSVSDFDGIPVVVSANTPNDEFPLVVLGDITIQNISKNPDAPTSDLMNVELQSYEVIFSRIDGGARTPPPYVRGIFGVVPVDGTIQITGLPVAGSEQRFNPPLSDLLFENGGFDPETGSTVITVNARIRFFGRTLSGDAVDTAPINFSMEWHR